MTSPAKTSPARHLIIMAKAPRLGLVKSRLARDIGLAEAWAFYRRTLADVSRRLAADGRWTTWLGVSPDGAALKGALWPVNCPRMAQGDGDLGQRMARLLSAVPPGPAVLIGADIPGIKATHINQAFRCLGANDAVFGPATDGGYWLVGMRHRSVFVDIFRDVRWSSADALDDTLANLPKRWRHGLVATLDDVDDGKAFRALGTKAETR
jgi:uncharacterized protein